MDSFPSPLYVAETKIHPSRERVTPKALPPFEIDVTSSRSETRLFRFLSPENATAVSPHTHSQTQIDKTIEMIRMLFILRQRSYWPDFGRHDSPGGYHMVRSSSQEVMRFVGAPATSSSGSSASSSSSSSPSCKAGSHVCRVEGSAF